MTQRASIAPPAPSKRERKRRPRRHDPRVRELAMLQEGWGEERPITYGAGRGGQGEHHQTVACLRRADSCLPPCPMWRATCFLFAGILPGFLASGQQVGFGH